MSEIFIYDDIGPDWLGLVSAKSVLRDLEKVAKDEPLTVRINSPGGDVFEAQAIYNILLRHEREVTIEVDALAASAASYIAMAGDTIRIAENAMMMIHQAWGFTVGNQSAHVKSADLLGKVDGVLADIYAARSKRSKEEIAADMNAETWYTAAEAVDAGLADEIGQRLNVSASVKADRFQHTPRRFLVDQLPRERERAMRASHTMLRIRLTKARILR